MDTPRESPEAAVATAELHLERGEPLVAYNETQEGLSRWPGNVRLRQLQALALARSGDIERANAQLRALTEDGFEDAETLGLLARTHKDLAQAAPGAAARSRNLGAAFTLYERAYARARNEGISDAAWYTGINAAAMAVLRNDLDRARRIAGEVRRICLDAVNAGEAPAPDYWREATLGEASLILGDAAGAAAHYGEARRLAGKRYGDLGSTRKQARLLMKHLPPAEVDVAAILAVPPVVVFTGNMIDAPKRSEPRFPPSLEGAVRAELSARLRELAPLAVYGSAACGTDILCLEIARELGIETHVVLPFPSPDFRVVSVICAKANWGTRFEASLVAADSVTLTSDHFARGSKATFEYANLVLTGMGRLRAVAMDTALTGIAVWDRTDQGNRGGAASVVHMWEQQGIAIEHVHLDRLRGDSAQPKDAAPAEAPLHPAVTHEIRALLFADAVGYSKLGEDQIPGYIEGFLGAVAELSRRTEHRFEHVETSGDGLYMVFRDARDAGHFALELSALANTFNRGAWGLPDSFGLRIAIHCGPVHCARDPITSLPMYTGPHTSRAARIEPITPPGQVYASSAFAAVAAAKGGRFAMSYVGRIPLAKSYGTLGLYHVRGAT